MKTKLLEKEFKRNSAKIKTNLLDGFGYLFCQRCKANNSPLGWQTHHIVYRSEAPRHRNLHHPSNLLFCCNDCHAFLHKIKANRLALVQERQLYLLFPEIKSLNETEIINKTGIG